MASIDEALYDWVKQGEHETLDLKQRIDDPAKIARSIVAFANTKGGNILDGVSDFGEVIGIDTEQEKYILRRAATEYCSPPVPLQFEELEFQRSKLLLVGIKPSEQKYHAALDDDGHWKVYIRKLDECKLVDEFHKYDESYYNDDRPIDILSDQQESLIRYLDRRDSINIKEYMHLMQIPYEIARRSLNDLVRSGTLMFIPSKQDPVYRLRRN